MQHLKTFETFNNDELLDYVKDILIDLKDINITYILRLYGESFYIRIIREGSVYRWSEVEPTIEHLISYLSDYGLKLNEEESTKDLLSSRENRPFNYLELRFDKVKEEKKGWKSLFQRNKNKYSTLDFRNGKIYVKYNGDEDRMIKVLQDTFPGCHYTTRGNLIKDRIYYAKYPGGWGIVDVKPSKLDKPIITENDIELSKNIIYESK
jgi:hypothetical protein